MQLLFKPANVDAKPADVEIKKKGRQNPSRVRDHLSNERTYLAWMRTAIAMMGFGVVIVRLRHFQLDVILKKLMGGFFLIFGYLLSPLSLWKGLIFQSANCLFFLVSL
jgi:putative membrane protein